MRSTTQFRRIAAGDYQSADGYRIHRVPDVHPPAWNAYRVADDRDVPVADGAATYRDARWFVDRDRTR